MEIEVVKDPARLAADATLAAQLDALGERSAVAQNLGRAITSTALFTTAASGQQQQQQALYVARDEHTGDAIGFLKTGLKHLFYVNKKGEYSEMDPLCVLDFFVDVAHQRAGIGLQLFNRLLQMEQVEPRQLAYDRPSPKLFAFLNKHCGLTNFFSQPNNFVVFDTYFDEHAPKQNNRRDRNSTKKSKETPEA